MRNQSLLSTDAIVTRYLAGEPMASIASAAGVTRIAVWKRIKAVGVAQNRIHPPVAHSCAHCGDTFARPAFQAPRFGKAFCRATCYRAWMQRGQTYRPNRHGQRTARKVVSAYYALQPGNVVHHPDRDNTHNALSNLAVFASQSDHMSHHKGGQGRPIWDGRMVTHQAP